MLGRGVFGWRGSNFFQLLGALVHLFFQPRQPQFHTPSHHVGNATPINLRNQFNALQQFIFKAGSRLILSHTA